MTATGKLDIKDYAIAFAMLLVLCGLATAGRMKISGSSDRNHDAKTSGDFALVAPDEFEPIRADITSDNPSKFTIDVENLANISADDDAPVFAVYVDSSLPDQCGDFRELKLDYKKPSKYERQFDLSQHEEVLNAIHSYGCVVMRNVPSKG
jgi:hypothetical protein